MNARTLIQAGVIAALAITGAVAQADTPSADSSAHPALTFKQAQAESIASISPRALFYPTEHLGELDMDVNDNPANRAPVQAAAPAGEQSKTAALSF